MVMWLGYKNKTWSDCDMSIFNVFNNIIVILKYQSRTNNARDHDYENIINNISQLDK